MTALRVVGSLDHSFALGRTGLLADTLCDPQLPLPPDLRGAAACATVAAAGNVRLLRDAIGLNKLFWAPGADGSPLLAARPKRLIDAGCSFSDIRAFPPGTVADFDPSCGVVRVTRLRPEPWPESVATSTRDVNAIAQEIHDTVNRYYAALATAHAGARVFICLSGGLDSAGIAVLARQYFHDVVAVSFDLRHGSGPASADRRTAERLARDLRLPLLCVTISEDDLLSFTDCVITEGIDWRDFNVHAGLVNAALADGIRNSLADAPEGTSALVMTGDLVNEFLVDYHAETYRDQTYYPLPRLGPVALRNVLVRGLETSHREVGVFEAWGLPVVQPHAAAVDAYLQLPDDFLAAPDGKQRLSRLVFGPQIPDYVYTRSKTRAQVGDPASGRGVLAACVDRGLDAESLRQRFATLHGISDLKELGLFIRGGRYRSGIPPLAGAQA